MDNQPSSKEEKKHDNQEKPEEINTKQEPKKEVDDLNHKKDKFLDEHKPMIDQIVRELWKKEKYKEIGNLQKIVREATKQIKEKIEKESKHESPTDKKPLNLELLKDYVLEVLANRIKKKYKEDFKSLVVGQSYNVKNDPSLVFVFKSNPKLYEKYKQFEGKKEKKEKADNKEKNIKEDEEHRSNIINSELNVLVGDDKRIELPLIKLKKNDNHEKEKLKQASEEIIGQTVVKPIIEDGLAEIENEKNKLLNNVEEEKKKLMAKAEEEKKKLLAIAEEEKKKLADKLEEEKKKLMENVDSKLNEMNPLNEIKGKLDSLNPMNKLEEERKKMEQELAKLNPLNDIGDPKNLLEPGGIGNAADKLKNVGGQAVNIFKNTVNNMKDHVKDSSDKAKSTNFLPSGEKSDIKLKIDNQNNVGDQIQKGKEQALEAMQKGKDQASQQLEKGKEELKGAIGNVKNQLKGKFGNLMNPKKLNIKGMLTLNNLVDCFKKVFGVLNQQKPLSERDKIIANLSFLSNVFFEMDNESQVLLKMVMKDYVEKKAKEYQEANPEKYKMEKEKVEKENKNPKKKKKKESYEEKLVKKYVFFEFDIVDIVLIIARMLKFLCGLTTTVQLEENEMYVKIYVKSKNLIILSECFDYEIQLKPYAYVYSQFKKEKRILKEEEAKALAEKLCQDKTQFHQIDLNDQKLISPYVPFFGERSDKFRRYLENDNYHTCVEDDEFIFNAHWDFESSSEEEEEEYIDDEEVENNEEVKKEEKKEDEPKCPQNCRIFRNIDKLRLIEQSIDEIANINLIKKHPDYNDSFYLRNYFQYKDRMTIDYIMYKRWNLYSYDSQMELIQTIRNYFGEKVAFYIFWIVSFNKWLTFISIIGVAVFILITFTHKLNIPLAKDANIDVISLIYLIFCVVVASWATFFLKVWSQTEKLYTHLWGMENVESSAPYRKEFRYDKKDDFVFDKKIPFEAYWKKPLRLTISYFIMLIMSALSIIIVNGLFKLNPDNAKTSSSNNSTNINNSTISSFLNSTNSSSNLNNSTGGVDLSGIFNSPWPIIIGILNGIQIEFFSYWFKRISQVLNDWENHEKNYQYEGSMIIKIVVYEVINNYNSLMFISFFKDIIDKCQGSNCMFELNVQVYTILMTKLGTKFVELKGVITSQDSVKEEYKEKYNKELEIQSLHHQRNAEEYSNLIADYNEMLILFGYNVFFCSAAPLTPLISFGITYMKKLIDSYKFFNCKKVNMIMGSNGIEIYNYLFTVFYYIGLLTNVAVVLFANPNLAKLDLYLKFVIFICVENVFVIVIFIFKVNILPHWFNNINLIDNQYNRKFFLKDGNDLPHHQFVEKKKPEWEEVNDSDDELFDEDDAFEEDDDEDNFYPDENEEEEEYHDNYDENIQNEDNNNELVNKEVLNENKPPTQLNKNNAIEDNRI